MPTYEYHCSNCNSTYELRQGFDATTEHVCEECKKGTAKRVLHAPRVLFKGSGFYVTDSKGKSAAAPTASPANGDAKSESKPESSESKTPAKTEAAASSSDSSSTPSSSTSAASSD